jgi:TRAP-type uncharacterized transport system fused permease subunit
MIAALILGCGMPTIEVDVLGIMVVAPVWVNMGLSVLQPHLL